MRYLRACGAHKLGFELALEEIDYKGVVSHLVPLPCLLRHYLHQHTNNIIRSRQAKTAGAMIAAISRRIIPKINCASVNYYTANKSQITEAVAMHDFKTSTTS